MRHLLILPVILLCGCAEKSKLVPYHRLEGEWIYQKGEEYFCEKWEITNDTLMLGTSFMTIKGDTVFNENLKLNFSNGAVYYTPTVPDQNAGKAVRFALAKRLPDLWIFRNEQHDFPTEIIYRFKGKDSLIATVQGIQNGRLQKINFQLKKK